MHCKFKSNITLHPKLQEYIRKKRYYNDFDIKPSISLEQEFNITHDDKKKIKQYLRDNEDLLKPHKLKVIQENDNLDSFFPSQFTKLDDPRMKNLNLKKPDLELPNNMGMFVAGKNERTCYPEELKNKKVQLLTHSRDLMENPVTRQKARDVLDPPINHKLNTHNNGSRIYKIPEIKYKRPLYPEVPVHIKDKKKSYHKTVQELECHNKFHKSAVNDIIGSLDTYKTHTSPDFSETADMDEDYKLCLPKMRCNKKRDTNKNYKPMPYLGYKEGNRNIDLESDMQQGLPSRLFTQKAKSHGYINPQEHYFDYISPDIQDPDHVVLPFPRGGYNTRLHNKQRHEEKIEREVY